jgi:hypothetical protein
VGDWFVDADTLASAEFAVVGALCATAFDDTKQAISAITQDENKRDTRL